MSIKIPKATDAGLGRERQRDVNALQRIDASPISLGPNSTNAAIQSTGRSISHSFGNNAIRRYQQQMKVSDENASMESYSEYSKELNKSSNLGENAWFSRKGKNAFGSYEEAQNTMDELAEKYSKNLTNDRQRESFLRRSQSHRNSLNESLSRHEAKQRSAYNIANEKSFVQTNIENASLNYSDPNQVRNAENNILEITNQNREGLPPDALELRLKSRISLVRTEVISKLSSSTPYKAVEYFEENKDSLTPEDQARAKSFISKGAEENFYSLLEESPLKAREALDSGFYSGVIDSKKKIQFESAITSQVNNLAKKAQTEQFLSTLKKEGELFDGIVSSNREDAFKKLYEYDKQPDSDPSFVERTREILLKSKGPSLEEKETTMAEMETKFQSFEIRGVGGDYEINDRVATLPALVEFSRSIELSRLRGTLTNAQANSYRKRITPAFIAATQKEQGYDDSGLFDGAEDYDAGTQAIQDYVEKNNIGNNSPEKVRLMSKFIELFEEIPDEIRKDKVALDEKIDELVTKVINQKAKNDKPIFRSLGVPNSVLGEDGQIKSIKSGDSGVKASEKVKSKKNNIISIGNGNFIRTNGQEADIVDANGKIIQGGFFIDQNGNLTEKK
mgnify:CR=1 FL=1